MEIISPYIIAGILGWVVAQSVKYLIISVRKRRLVSLRQLYGSGNMPSAHSATVVAVLVLIGLIDGIDSGLFGLAAVFSGDDETGYRYIIGSRNADLRKAAKSINSGISGRGGGSPEMIQGSCTACSLTIQNFLTNFTV